MVVVLSSWHFQNSDGSSNFWVTTPTARRSKARDIGAQKHTSSSIDLSVTHPLSCSQRWEEELLIMLQRARHLTHQDHRSRLPLVAMFALDSRFHVIQFAFILSPSQTRWVTLYVTFWCIVESRCGARVNLDFGVSRADIRSQSERRGGQKETSCKNV